MEKPDLSRTVKLTPGFVTASASWDLTEPEKTRRCGADFGGQGQPLSDPSCKGDEMKTPNIIHALPLPADAEEEAHRLGYTLEQYVWLVVEDAIARHPEAIQRVMRLVVPDVSSEKVVPFHEGHQAA